MKHGGKQTANEIAKSPPKGGSMTKAAISKGTGSPVKAGIGNTYQAPPGNSCNLKGGTAAGSA